MRVEGGGGEGVCVWGGGVVEVGVEEGVCVWGGGWLRWA